MDIASLFVIILIYALCFFVFLKNEKLRNENQTYYIGFMVRENKLDLIANQLRLVVEEIEDVEGYSSAKEYLPTLKSVFHIANYEYHLEFARSIPPAEPTATEPERDATAVGGA